MLASAPHRRSEVYRVGMVIPLQGPGGIFGPSCMAVSELARRELNAGAGFGGREIQLEFIDGGRDPARSQPRCPTCSMPAPRCDQRMAHLLDPKTSRARRSWSGPVCVHLALRGRRGQFQRLLFGRISRTTDLSGDAVAARSPRCAVVVRRRATIFGRCVRIN